MTVTPKEQEPQVYRSEELSNNSLYERKDVDIKSSKRLGDEVNSGCKDPGVRVRARFGPIYTNMTSFGRITV